MVHITDEGAAVGPAVEGRGVGAAVGVEGAAVGEEGAAVGEDGAGVGPAVEGAEVEGVEVGPLPTPHWRYQGTSPTVSR